MTLTADDAIAIQMLVARYSHAASAGDAAGVAATFTEDGILTGFAPMLGQPDPDTVGRAAIRAMFEGFLPAIDFIHQLSQLSGLEATADGARGNVMVIENVQWRGRRAVTVNCRYADEYVRTVEGWRFRHRVLTPISVTDAGEVQSFAG